jgi:hypothetical protein
MSYDPNAYYNPDAEPVEIIKFINTDNELEVMEAAKALKEEEKKLTQEHKVIDNTDNKEKQELPDDIWREIKERLNPNIKIKREKNIYVPKELDEIMENIKMKMLSVSIEILHVDKINYGKKFRFGAKNRFAEVNIFYGKKGFSVVPTTKTGSDKELAELCKLLLCEILY